MYFADLDLIDLTFSKHGDPNYIDSLIVEDGNGLNLHVHGADLANNGIEQFVFADGSIAEEIVIGDTQKTGFVGTVNNDVIDFGGNVGVGFEAAQGSAGDDAYILRAGYGNVAVIGEDGTGNDSIYFMDLLRSDVSVTQHPDANRPDSLIIADGNGLNLHVHGATGANNGIKQFVFADGTVITDFFV